MENIQQERMEEAKRGGLISDYDVEFFEKIFLGVDNGNRSQDTVNQGA
jgi:hypothetical protein